MRSHRHMGVMLASALLAAGVPLAEESEPRKPVKPTVHSPVRLSKAEKKRARKAAQRLRLLQAEKARS